MTRRRRWMSSSPTRRIVFSNSAALNPSTTARPTSVGSLRTLSIRPCASSLSPICRSASVRASTSSVALRILDLLLSGDRASTVLVGPGVVVGDLPPVLRIEVDVVLLGDRDQDAQYDRRLDDRRGPHLADVEVQPSQVVAERPQYEQRAGGRRHLAERLVRVEGG